MGGHRFFTPCQIRLTLSLEDLIWKFLNYATFSKLHIFEPIPQFNEQLEKKYKELAETNNWDVTVHKFGLGATNRYLALIRRIFIKGKMADSCLKFDRIVQ